MILAEDFEPRNRQHEFECADCRDTLYVQVVVKYRGYDITESRKCKCLLKKQRKRLLEKIPEEFRGVTLNSLEARPEIHKDQPKFVALLKSEPAGKFAISGDFGTGKTHFFWSLYEHAVSSDRRVWAGTSGELINEFTKTIEAAKRGDCHIPAITAEEIREMREPFSLFLDDFDKVNPTEFASEKLFAILDACYGGGHQIVFTTNMTLSELENRFKGTYGGAIVRRLLHYSHEIEMW